MRFLEDSHKAIAFYKTLQRVLFYTYPGKAGEAMPTAAS